MVQRLLTDAGRADLLELAELLVSEVVTNALVHSATPIDVSMAASGDGVLVEVGDGSPHIPSPRHYAPTASTGRGLALLDRAATAWGVLPGIRGKTVWFQLAEGADIDVEALRAERAADSVVPVQQDEKTVTVELLNVPLLLHAAWQQHAEAVLREHLLASLDAGLDDDPFSVHAATTDALAVLREQVPQPDALPELEHLMAAAVDTRFSSPRVEVHVPLLSVPHFGLLAQTLDAAQRLAERGRLLVPVVQPEVRMLRHWLCDQVSAQGNGGPASPWPPQEPPGQPAIREIAWDPSAVTASTEARIAADDRDVVMAVSPPAVVLLGYEHDELVGQRLISIIPPRYRQAHLAGFTLYMLTGRGPLLSRPVVMPALRRDGVEIHVELSVSAHRVSQGRSVFVATLRPAGQPPG